MCKKIDSLVELCLKEHTGGEIFFDAIDEKLRNDDTLLKMITDKVLNNEVFDFIIVSGNFGNVFKKFIDTNLKELTKKVIVVNGGLRKGEKIVSFWEEYDISMKKIVFIDDSFYLGRTRDKIEEMITKHQGTLINTYVFYDGSKEKEENVHSFYRYYDNFPLS